MDLASLQIREELGRGAMGTVHRAYDPASGREVAIKVLQSGSILRFEREGILSAQLDHPNIVRIHTSGVREGQPCLVYELIEGGRTLGDMLREGCLRRRALEVLLGAARGLGHAHAQGIIHRDVKPDNVLIEGGGRAKVSDFGLAKLEGLDQLTATGAVLGTPLYMAPEALTGKRALVGPGTDVWGLGAILYETLSGLPPYSADTIMTLTIQVVGSATPPIDAKHQAPEALVEIATRALAKDPAERYPSGDAFADDLERYLQGGQQEGRPAVRRRLGLAAGVALLLLIAGLAFALRPAGTESAVSPPPSSPSLTPKPSPITPLQSWSEVAAIEDPLESYLAIRRWLKRNEEHARAPRARRSLKRALSRPLSSVSLGGRSDERVLAVFAPRRRVLAAAQRGGVVTCWEGSRKTWAFKGTARCGVLSAPRGPLWWSAPPVRFYQWGPAGPSAPPLLELGDREVRYAALSPKGDRVALTTVGPPTLLVARWPSGPLEHTLSLPEPAHVVMFGSRGDHVAVGIGRADQTTFTPRGSELLLVYTATGKVAHRAGYEAGVPLALALEPNSSRVLVGLSSGNLHGFDPQTGVRNSFPPFAANGTVDQTFGNGSKALLFDSSGETLWVATNGAESSSRLIAIDWKTGTARHTRSIADATETLTISADDALLLRGTRSGTWQLWATATD